MKRINAYRINKERKLKTLKKNSGKKCKLLYFFYACRKRKKNYSMP